MKKLFLISIILGFVLSGCITDMASYTPPEQTIRIITDKGAKIEKEKKDDIQKMMEVKSHDLELSDKCRIDGNTAYLSVSISFGNEELWRDLKILSGMPEIEHLYIYMNSPGGSATGGMSVTDELRIFKQSGVIVHMFGRGIIASAAIPVFLAGTEGYRTCSKYTIFLIHPAKLWKWGMFSEGLEDLQSQAKMIKMLQENYANSVANSSDLTRDEVLKLMEKDNWFTAEEALNLRMTDKIE